MGLFGKCGFRRAADEGYAEAQYRLGVMYGEGRGVPQDHSEALKWRDSHYGR